MIDTQNTALTADDQLIREEFNRLIEDYLDTNHRQKVDLITKAFHFANQAHAGVKRRSGEPYIMHPLAVARIVCKEMGLGSTSICSALLHDVVEDTEYTVEDIENMFGKKIAQIVDGLTKISGGIFGDQASVQAENFRKLLLTMSDDIRVVLIKIADRLHNMRTLGSLRPAKQYKIAGETQYLYAPMAHRLGLFSIKTELEDLSFKYEHPQEYELIANKLKATEETRNTVFKHFSAPVYPKLEALGMKYDMKARVKSIFSIWNKMETKGVTFDEIYDIYAVRIIFDSLPGIDDKNLCWDIYSAITDIYRIRPDRIRDWVSRPKANGYQALHLTVMGPDGHWVEIQIRSRKMDEIAEKGFAAHWKYKGNNIEEDTELDRWLKTITEILENPNPNALDFLDTIKLNLFTSEIFVFTPKGDIKTLPQDATALDFAYALHTNIGNKCIGAKVNNRLVPLSHQLKSGDQVEILTSRSQMPQLEWLNFVTTAKAHTKIDSALKKMRKEAIREGEKKVLSVFNKVALEPTTDNLDKLGQYFSFENRDEFFHAVGKGDVTLTDNLKNLLKDKKGNAIFRYVKQALRLSRNQKTTENEQPHEIQEIDKKKPYVLSEKGYNEHNYIIAQCCKPIPGDDSLGFINDDGKVVVHKRSCPIGTRLKSSFGERILSTEWSDYKNLSFEATLEVKGIDTLGVLNMITRVLSEEFNVSILHLSIDAKDGVFQGRIKINVHNVEDIQKICVRLGKENGIKSIVRVAN